METTIDQFIKELQSIKPSWRKLPLVIIAPNGLEFEPKIKRLIYKETIFDEPKKMVITI